jgi:hypothetical protein
MTNIIPNSNLPASSQPWGREIQKRLQSLESEVARQKINNNSADAQLQSSYRRIDQNLDGLFGLGSAGSPYQINASNINAGTLNANLVSVTNLNASNITSGTIASGRITSDSISAANVNADRINAGTLNGNIVSVTNLNAGNITSGTIASGRITSDSISAANIGAGQITSGTISSARIDSNSISAANISAGQITSGTISSDRIATSSLTAANLNADNINAGSISGDRISAGTITGSTVQTSSSGKRVRMSSSTNALEIINTSGVVSGRIQAIGSASQQIIMQSANATGSFVASDNSISIGAGNDFINLEDGSLGMTVQSDSVKLRAIGTSVDSNYNIVHSQNGGPSVQGRLSRIQLSGTGVRNVNVGALGILTISTSDERLKQNIEPLLLGLNLIEKLEPKKFEFKENPGTVEYGLIAQEVKAIIETIGITDKTNLVFEDESEENLSKLPDGELGPVLGVEYMKLIPILINSVKELQDRIKTLEEERKNI